MEQLSSRVLSLLPVRCGCLHLQGLTRTALDKAAHSPTGEDQHPTPNISTPDPDSPFPPSRGPRSPSTGVRTLPPPAAFPSVLGPLQTCPSQHRNLEKGPPRGHSLSMAPIAQKDGGGQERWEGRVQGHVTHSRLKTQASSHGPAQAQARSAGEEHSFPFVRPSWVSAAARGLSLVAERFSLEEKHVESSCMGPNPRPLGLNPRPPHWQGSQPLDHQGRPHSTPFLGTVPRLCQEPSPPQQPDRVATITSSTLRNGETEHPEI